MASNHSNAQSDARGRQARARQPCARGPGAGGQKKDKARRRALPDPK